MSDTVEPAPQSREYWHIALPRDPVARSALRAVVRLAGGHMWKAGAESMPAAQTAGTEARRVDSRSLQKASERLWGGATYYGDTAWSILEDERHARQGHFTSVVYREDDQLRTQYFQHPADTIGVRVAPEDVEDVTREWLAGLPLAHTVAITSAVESDVLRGSDKEALLRLNPEIVTTATLHSFVMDREYPACELRGTIGKAIRALNDEAGVVLGDDAPDPHFDGEFITAAALREMLSSSRLSSHYQTTIPGKLTGFATIQARQGAPVKVGEIILEGPFTVRERGFDQVAISSLAALADSFKKDTPARKFLREKFGKAS